MADEKTQQLIELTAGIAASYVANNIVAGGDLPALIHGIHAALSAVGEPTAAIVEERRAPAVSIRKSVGEDFLICLEDGLKFRSLKRHLRTKYNMTPEDYRARWGLPADYPMVAPTYAAARSAMAKQMGLGAHGRSSMRRPAKARQGRPKAVKLGEATDAS